MFFWEYYTHWTNGDDLDAELRLLGDKRWELVSATPFLDTAPFRVFLVFKRPKDFQAALNSMGFTQIGRVTG